MVDWWDWNLHTSTYESPTLPLCYKRQPAFLYNVSNEVSDGKKKVYHEPDDPPATINGSQSTTMLHWTGNWELVIPYESTAETYLQSLQFRIMHCYFPCRYNLHLWNIVGDNKCEFCNDADTLSHYFAECDSVVQFWKFLKKIVHSHLSICHKLHFT